MAIGDSAGILFKIRADNQASGEINKLKGDVGGLGGGLESLAGPAAIAATAVAAIGTAAVIAGTRLFQLASSTAEYGSQLYDIAQKTGLAAETISSLKIAADQSGASIEAVSSGLSKFAKLIGEASEGSEDAQDKMAKLGVTSDDLDTALGQALATIAKYPPGVQQMTAAQAAFGKSGADLIPMIRSFDGNLPALIAKCKELGLTLSEAALIASDEFGDSLDQLGAQAAAVGRQFALEFMPDITRAMNDISRAFVANKESIRDWSESLGNFVRGVIKGFREIIDFYNANPILARVLLGIATAGASEAVITGAQALSAAGTTGDLTATMGGQARIGRGFTPAASSVARAKEQRPNVMNVPGLNLTGQFEALEREREQRNTREREAMEYNIAYDMATRRKAYAEYLRDTAGDEKTTADDIARYKEQLEAEALEYRKKQLADYKAFVVKNTGRGADPEIGRVNDEARLLDLKIEETRAGNAANEKTRQAAALADQEKINAAYREFLNSQQKANARPTSMTKRTATEMTGDGFRDAAGILEKNLKGDQLTASTIALDTMAQAFQQLGQAAGEAAYAFVLFGSSGQGLKKFTATMIAEIARMATIQAVWELAQGLAMLALNFFWPDPKVAASAAHHFKSAAMYGVLAAGAAGVGRAVAGGSFNEAAGAGGGGRGGNGGGQSGAPTQPGAFTTNPNNPFATDANGAPVARMVADMLQKSMMVNAQLEETTNQLATKLTSMSPGHVVAMGAADARDAIGREVVAAIGENPGVIADQMKRNLNG